MRGDDAEDNERQILRGVGKLIVGMRPRRTRIPLPLAPPEQRRLALKFRFVVGWMEGRPNQAKSTPRLNERQRMRTVSPLTKFLPTDLCDLNSHVSLSRKSLSEKEISKKRKKKTTFSRCTKEFSPFPFPFSLSSVPPIPLLQ